eukprot:5665353-Alexandrium_andersonii.AAC.1
MISAAQAAREARMAVATWVRRAMEHGRSAILAATASIEAWRAWCSGLLTAPQGPNWAPSAQPDAA